MADPSNLTPHLETLTNTLTTLSTALQPLTSTPTTQLASPLPLLDKAKLHVLTAYTIDSLLFAAVRLGRSSAEARAHPVFAELARTRAYFEKIKEAEVGPEKPRLRVDKKAVGRFVKAGIAPAAPAAPAGPSVGVRDVKDGTGKRKTDVEGDNFETGTGEESDKKRRRKEREKQKKKDDSKFLWLSMIMWTDYIC
jgi:exosome complex protein LRP1